MEPPPLPATPVPWGGGSPSAARGAQRYPPAPKAISDLTSCALQRGHRSPGGLHRVLLPQVGLCRAPFVPLGGLVLKTWALGRTPGPGRVVLVWAGGVGPCRAAVTGRVLPKLSEPTNERCSLPGLGVQRDPRGPHGFGEGRVDQCTFAFCTLPPPLARGWVLGAGGPRCAPAHLLCKRFCFPWGVPGGAEPPTRCSPFYFCTLCKSLFIPTGLGWGL